MGMLPGVGPNKAPQTMKARIIAARCGDILQIAQGEFPDVYPHSWGMLGIKERPDKAGQQDGGRIATINGEPYYDHIVRAQYVLPFGDGIIERDGKHLVQVRFKAGKEVRSKICTIKGEVRLLPYEGGIVIESADPEKISLVPVPELLNGYNWLRLFTGGCIHKGPWDRYYLDHKAVIVSNEGTFWRNGKVMFTDPFAAEAAEWFLYGKDFALLFDDELLDRRTKTKIWPDSVGNMEIFSCNHRLVLRTGDRFWISTNPVRDRPSFFWTELAPQEGEPGPDDRVEVITQHWNGLILRRHRTYFLLVIK
jgi:hypothetical protein